jgi:Mn2+/Fe2+ NRAMP family transporter
MNQVAFRGTLIVGAHTIVLFGHAIAHSHLQIEPSPWQRLFIAIVIFAVPVLAALLLWTRWQRAGMTLLGISLGGALLFGLYYHFVAGGPDSVFNPIHTHWNMRFAVTAVLLALVEITGCVWRFVPRRYSWNSGFEAIES